MDKWSVDIKTHRRNDVMKICILLADAIGLDALTKRRIEINIVGSVRSGKSAIADALAASFSDNHSSYHLPCLPMIEKFSGEARKRKSKITLSAGGQEAVFTLLHYISESDIRMGHRDLSANIRPNKGGIDFLTVCGHEPMQKGDITMGFNNNWRDLKSEWARKWSITIRDPNLQTPEMERALDYLRCFHARRQVRHSNAPIDILTP